MASRNKVINTYLRKGRITCQDAGKRMVDCQCGAAGLRLQKRCALACAMLRGTRPFVVDRLTGFVWRKNANMAEFPLAWQGDIPFRGCVRDGCGMASEDERETNMQSIDYRAYSNYFRIRAIALASIKHARVMVILAIGKGTVSKR